jgi:hypothetical protein
MRRLSPAAIGIAGFIVIALCILGLFAGIAALLFAVASAIH